MDTRSSEILRETFRKEKRIADRFTQKNAQHNEEVLQRELQELATATTSKTFVPPTTQEREILFTQGRAPEERFERRVLSSQAYGWGLRNEDFEKSPYARKRLYESTIYRPCGAFVG
ncbi:hypothetical protein PAPYR_3992 [Paratrimastix pyriformis]|uniref:Sperm microtubule inner protein 1 C-terminal domain-containing protein n=1 Tax=Paratrimastix pyriformis TaxID=342808 RepID=A0ABQ8UL44_9EUKA|nr:hypothetical protein PAPYR_3992 [Paratrimastix pyriformis]